MAGEENQIEEAVSADAELGDESAMEKDWQASERQVAAEPASLEELRDEGRHVSTATPELDVILDIPVNISMEVGNTDITIRNLLQLNQGSVIELDRLAGEPLDVRVNGTLIAHGEVVVVNEKFGIRLTDVVSPSERIKKLR
ncbi:MAG: flagellar motor switch protein FliN [Pseudomonadales bacterium]|nr:flagellar motor switch protein FliN [Pseudomonadales bacterium]